MPHHIEAYRGLKLEIDDQKIHFPVDHEPTTVTRERSMLNFTCMYTDMSSEHSEQTEHLLRYVSVYTPGINGVKW